jgi:pimeloyl-ACP methyl ester carboxylesterase
MAFVHSSGVRIHYEIEGDDGAPLILHTGGGGDLEMWRTAGYTADLADRRLILMDHRGRGASDRPRGVEQHRIDSYVDDVLAVAEAAGAGHFSFFGYSGGATIGYRLAARDPDRIDALIGLGTVGPRSADDVDSRSLAAMVRAGGPETLPRLLREDEPEIPGWFSEQMRRTDPEMFAISLEAWTSWGGPWTEFSRVRAPTLIVVGQLEEDNDDAERHAAQAATILPNGSAVVLPALGHVMAFVRSDLVLPHVLGFLERVAPAGR